MIDYFIEKIIEKVNEYYTCYYEEAPNNANFPYLIMPTTQLSPLDDNSFSCVFDIEIYINELSNVSIEEIIDTLRDELNNYFYKDDKLAFHLGFDNHLLVKSTEQDLSIRRITFTARIFR